MAKPGALAELIAELFRAEVPTVRQQARELRDHGFMQKEKGGRGLGTLSAADAAHLVVAAACTASVRESPEVIKAPGHMVSQQGGWQLRFLPIPELTALGKEHTLIEAVAALIESGISGHLPQLASRADGSEVDLARDSNPGLRIEVTVKGPIRSATVRIALFENDQEGVPQESKIDCEQHDYSTYKRGDSELGHLHYGSNEDYQIDLSAEFTFTHRTIMRVAELLRR